MPEAAWDLVLAGSTARPWDTLKRKLNSQSEFIQILYTDICHTVENTKLEHPPFKTFPLRGDSTIDEYAKVC